MMQVNGTAKDFNLMRHPQGWGRWFGDGFVECGGLVGGFWQS